VANGDIHIRRSGDDYGEGFSRLLPRGDAWDRDPGKPLSRLLRGLGQIWGNPVDSRAADLLEIETDPRQTVEMLPDWEAAFGLPDACVAERLTVADRQKALVQKMTTEGGQSIAYFKSIATALGYSIVITEYSPFMCGVSQCGDTRPLDQTTSVESDYRWQIGPPEIRFYWRIHVLGIRLTWFRCGAGECGVDPLVRIALATDLECLFRRYKPAHTDVIFDYSDSAQTWVEYAWFRCGSNDDVSGNNISSQCGVDHIVEFITHSR
jgi:uncharacterized protein YmfQ (DUF2313 family)